MFVQCVPSCMFREDVEGICSLSISLYIAIQNCFFFCETRYVFEHQENPFGRPDENALCPWIKF